MPLTTVAPASDEPSEARPEPRIGSVIDRELERRVVLAACRAKQLYPGPVGELIYRELLSWQEFGYRLGGDSLVMRLVAHVTADPAPYPRAS